MPSDESRAVTATLLRDVFVCERRAWHDAHTDAGLRDRTSTFVEMLWAEGLAHEREVLGTLVAAVDLRRADPSRRRELTLAALADPAAEHVLGGEIASGDLVGRPDVISRIDGRWVGGDVKAGSAFMADGARVKGEYAVQVALYATILGEAGIGDGGRAFVIGADGDRALLSLDEPWGASTIRSLLGSTLALARGILSGDADARGAASAVCGLCHWRGLCRAELESADDLTLLAEVGRDLRGRIEQVAATRSDLAALDLSRVARPDRRTAVRGLGLERLARFRDRARLQLTPGAKAYAHRPLGLARARKEWHLDIEADPISGGLVYLHGVWERILDEDGERGRFVHFMADASEREGEAFASAWAFLSSDPEAKVYYYSRFERTSYRALQRRHPHVCAAADVEAFFASDNVVDLYSDVVRPLTEWPLGSYGLKAIAKHLGFGWRAEDASGASSIAWWSEWLEGRDPAVRERIVDYNRSDCIASAWVLDGLIALPVGGVPAWPVVGAGRTGVLRATPGGDVGSRGRNDR